MLNFLRRNDPTKKAYIYMYKICFTFIITVLTATQKIVAKFRSTKRAIVFIP